VSRASSSLRGRLAALFLITLAGACGTAGDSGDDEVSAQTSALADETSVCSASEVAWTPSVATSDERKCAGPWQYKRAVRPCYNTHDNDPACPYDLDASGNYKYPSWPDCHDYTSCNLPVLGDKVLEEDVVFYIDGIEHPPVNTPTFQAIKLPRPTAQECNVDPDHCLCTTATCPIKANYEERITNWLYQHTGMCHGTGCVDFEYDGGWPWQYLHDLGESHGMKPWPNGGWARSGPSSLNQLAANVPGHDADGPTLLMRDGTAANRWVPISGEVQERVIHQMVFFGLMGDTAGVWATHLRIVYHQFPTGFTTEPRRVNWRKPDGSAMREADLPQPHCALETDPHVCSDLANPMHIRCALPSFGDAPAGTCGTTTDTFYSRPGMRYSELKSLEPDLAITGPDAPVCLTTEDLPMTSTSEVRTKQQALLDRIRRASTSGYPGVDNATLLRQLVVNAKKVLEMRGDALAGQETADAGTLGDQIGASLDLYSLYSGASYTPTCGRLPVPPPTTGCDAGLLNLNQLNVNLAMCERFTSTHVAPAVRARTQVFERCVALADKMKRLRDRMVAKGELDDGSSTDTGHDKCHFKAYRDRFKEVVTRPLREQLSSIVEPPTEAGGIETSTRMAKIDAWYVGLSLLYPGIGQGSDADAAAAQRAGQLLARWRETSDVTGAFWRGIYRKLYKTGDPYVPPADELHPPVAGAPGADAGPPGDAGVPPSAEVLASAAHDQLDADRQIVKLAFTPFASRLDVARGRAAALPLTHAPLLYVLHDALEAMHTRLTDLALYHDVGCAYLGCDAVSFPSETVRLWRLMSLLGDGEKLGQEVSTDRILHDEGGHVIVRNQWLDPLDKLAQNHIGLDRAIADALDKDVSQVVPADLLSNAISEIPAPLATFAVTVRDAVAKVQAFEGGGLLLGPISKLTAGAHEDRLTQRRTLLSGYVDKLEARVTSYKSSIIDLARGLIQEFQLDALVAGADNHRKQTLAEIGELMDNQAALRNGILDAETAFANRMAGYAKLASIDANAVVSKHAIAERHFAASSAKANGRVASFNFNAHDLSSEAPETLATGEILQLETTGHWAPSCAVSRLNPMVMPGLPEPRSLGVAHPFTGPEGYMLTLQGTTYQVQSHEEANSVADHLSFGTAFAACAGIRGAGGASIFGNGIQAYFDISVCAKFDTGETRSSTSTDQSGSGVDDRTTAAFSAGLHTPNAPFPQYPVGALLLVITPAGSPTQILDVKVVQAGATSYLAPKPVDVYFIANDLAVCNDDDSNTLLVRGAVVQHRGQVLGQLEKAIGDAITGLDARRAAIVKQGRLLPYVAASLKAEALRTIVATSGVELATLPPSVQSFLDGWLDAVLARMELEIEHKRVSLDLSAKELQLMTEIDDLRYGTAQSRIASLLPGLALRNLDAAMIRGQARLVAGILLDDIYPLITIRHRGLFASLLSNENFQTALLELVRAPWDSPVDDIGRALVDAGSAVLEGLGTVDGATPELVKVVVLAIPKPGVRASWLSVDEARAKTFWDGVLSPSHRGSITITPEDIYRDGVGLGIGCNFEAPVIRDMALVVSGLDATTAQNEMSYGWEVATSANQTLMFPTAALPTPSNAPPPFPGTARFDFAAGGPLTYVIDPSWAVPSTPMIFTTQTGQARDEYTTRRPDTALDNSARGLSPFTTWTFDMNQLWNPENRPVPDPDIDSTPVMNAASEAHVLIRLEARSLPPQRSLRFIGRCRSAPVAP